MMRTSGDYCTGNGGNPALLPAPDPHSPEPGGRSAMTSLARFVIAHRWWVLAAWLLLAVAGGYAAPKAISALTYDFGLPGQAGYEANQQIVEQFGSGGDNAPILLVVGNGRQPVLAASAIPVMRAAEKAAPGARVVS